MSKNQNTGNSEGLSVRQALVSMLNSMGSVGCEMGISVTISKGTNVLKQVALDLF